MKIFDLMVWYVLVGVALCVDLCSFRTAYLPPLKLHYCYFRKRMPVHVTSVLSPCRMTVGCTYQTGLGLNNRCGYKAFFILLCIRLRSCIPP
ncbi:hypothetical protein TNCT_656911 [Trichonephila clavata]|uniref:Uncharacterized protein n=1 Tax=Trichonephila clavata TaxID=2740835 RepID=A0A8X6H4V9_TRICU|nr:hypothetical protein TNCT_656911 [Trichonephila clavata]